jgi:hypothetical protein
MMIDLDNDYNFDNLIKDFNNIEIYKNKKILELTDIVDLDNQIEKVFKKNNLFNNTVFIKSIIKNLNDDTNKKKDLENLLLNIFLIVKTKNEEKVLPISNKYYLFIIYLYIYNQYYSNIKKSNNIENIKSQYLNKVYRIEKKIEVTYEIETEFRNIVTKFFKLNNNLPFGKLYEKFINKIYNSSVDVNKTFKTNILKEKHDILKIILNYNELDEESKLSNNEINKILIIKLYIIIINYSINFIEAKNTSKTIINSKTKVLNIINILNFYIAIKHFKSRNNYLYNKGYINSNKLNILSTSDEIYLILIKNLIKNTNENINENIDNFYFDNDEYFNKYLYELSNKYIYDGKYKFYKYKNDIKYDKKNEDNYYEINSNNELENLQKLFGGSSNLVKSAKSIKIIKSKLNIIKEKIFIPKLNFDVLREKKLSKPFGVCDFDLYLTAHKLQQKDLCIPKYSFKKVFNKKNDLIIYKNKNYNIFKNYLIFKKNILKDDTIMNSCDNVLDTLFQGLTKSVSYYNNKYNILYTTHLYSNTNDYNINFNINNILYDCSNQRFIYIPLKYESYNSLLEASHTVTILIDRKKYKIYYYDPMYNKTDIILNNNIFFYVLNKLLFKTDNNLENKENYKFISLDKYNKEEHKLQDIELIEYKKIKNNIITRNDSNYNSNNENKHEIFENHQLDYKKQYDWLVGYCSLWSLYFIMTVIINVNNKINVIDILTFFNYLSEPENVHFIKLMIRSFAAKFEELMKSKKNTILEIQNFNEDEIRKATDEFNKIRIKIKKFYLIETKVESIIKKIETIQDIEEFLREKKINKKEIYKKDKKELEKEIEIIEVQRDKLEDQRDKLEDRRAKLYNNSGNNNNNNINNNNNNSDNNNSGNNNNNNSGNNNSGKNNNKILKEELIKLEEELIKLRDKLYILEKILELKTYKKKIKYNFSQILLTVLKKKSFDEIFKIHLIYITRNTNLGLNTLLDKNNILLDKYLNKKPKSTLKKLRKYKKYLIEEKNKIKKSVKRKSSLLGDLAKLTSKTVKYYATITYSKKGELILQKRPNDRIIVNSKNKSQEMSIFEKRLYQLSK